MKLLDVVAGCPWATTQANLEAIVEVLETVPTETVEHHRLRIEALEARLGRPLDNTREVTTRAGVATIPVVGTIARRMNLFTQISGGTSVETLARDFRAALDDPSVRAIVLDLDSPGGEAAGIHEMAALVASARGVKPVVAYCDGDCCSGAYWIASACAEVVANATSALGSIGVAATVRSRKDPARFEFVSTLSPNKRLDVETDAGKAAVQAHLDDLAGVFVADVARYRGVPEATVLADFGKGGVLVGAKAVAAGMADRLGTYESLLSDLMAGRLASQRGTGRPAASAPQGTIMAEDTTPNAGADDELARLKAEIEAHKALAAAERAGRIADARASAGSYVDTLVEAERLLPAEAADLRPLLEALAADDVEHPVAAGISRVALARKFVGNRQPGVMARDVADAGAVDEVANGSAGSGLPDPQAARKAEAKRLRAAHGPAA